MTQMGCIGVMVAAALSATIDDQPKIRFEDVTQASGIDFVTTSGIDPSSQILEVKGGGVVLIDFDADGDDDLFIPNGATLASPQGGPGARLYENLGQLRFRDVTRESGIDHHKWSFGSAVGDVDGDGLDDIYIACLGDDVLWRNLGHGKFVDATAAAGLGQEHDWSTSAAFGDLDGDGDLDLHVTNYVAFDFNHPPGPAFFRGIPVINGPRGMPAVQDRLYENIGSGKFIDRSVASGIASAKPSYGLNSAIVDLTGDGKPDIYVNNDSMDNFLFENLGGFRFREIAQSKGCATNIEGMQQASMGLALGDVNADGRPDLFSTNFSDDTNTLFVSSPSGFFDDRTAQYGVGILSRTLCGWAAVLADLDHDADEDLFIVNGHVYPQATMSVMNSEYRQPKLVMTRSGGRFSQLVDPDQEWLARPRRDRSAVLSDLDGDGDLDALVAGLNEPIQVLQNRHDNGGDWVTVELDDRRNPGNRRGIGSKIELRRGEVGQTRWLFGGGAYQSNHPPRVHFGLGQPSPSTGEPMHAIITWPDGEVSTHQVTRGTHARITRAAKP